MVTVPGATADPGDPVTMADVARLAGVSTASVSRVLSGRRAVSPAVESRVRDAAAALGYEVDLLGRALRTRSTLTVGLVVADIVNPFFPSLIQALERALADVGHGLLLADACDDVNQEAEVVRRLLSRRVDALVITPVDRRLSAATVAQASAGRPVVQLDRRASARAHYVGIDHAAAVGDLLAHLDATGATRPAFLGSDPGISTSWERQVAFVRAAPRRDPAAATRVLVGDYTREWGRAGVVELLRRWPEVDAVVCANDLIALGALEGLRAGGVRVPQEVQVVGFDDTLVSQVAGLTSVRQPLEQMARHAAELVTRRDSGARRILLPAALVPRGSSAGAAPS